jgi:type II secretory pathway component PulC
MFKEISAIVVGWIAFIVLAMFGSFWAYQYFAPKYRAVDNQVFKQSEQYNDGMIRDLENLQVEYINADAEKKQALRAIVLHRFSVYPEDKMPPNLRNFYNDLKAGK